MSYLASLTLSSPAQRRSLFSPAPFNSSLIPHFANTQILGPTHPDDLRGGSHRVLMQVEGHTGCVNGLDWEEGRGGMGMVGGSAGVSSGGRLASAGDDTKICIWQAGLLRTSAESYGKAVKHPPMNMGLEACIDTGHSANIFSVKWAPGNSSRLFSCAGDRQVRVFDINHSTPSSKMSTTRDGIVRTWAHYETESCCTKVLRCHTGRVKKIATEESSDVFLTCSEDGAVRQHDLRVDHTCLPSRAICGPPLLQYPTIQLYSLSISKARPHMFVCAGTSNQAYLHDRRMIRSSMMRDWGVEMKSGDDGGGFTQCVRRFGVINEKGQEVDEHVTATKLGETNVRDLLLSYSNDLIYLFDTDAPPEEPPVPVSPRTVLAKPKPSTIDEEAEGWEDAEKDPDEEENDVEMSENSASTTSKRVAEAQEEGESEHKRRKESDSEDAEEIDEEVIMARSMDEGMIDPEEANEGGEENASPAFLGLSDDDSDSDLDSTTPIHLQSSDNLALLETQVPLVRPKQKYTGHINCDTVKDVNFAFGDLNVMSGSDDGNLFIWDKETGGLKAIFEGDSNVVNVMKPHPNLPVLAVSGIDATVKIFGPTSDPDEEANLLEQAEEITTRNGERRSANRFEGRMSQSLMEMFASAAPPNLAPNSVRLVVNGREQDCVVM